MLTDFDEKIVAAVVYGLLHVRERIGANRLDFSFYFVDYRLSFSFCALRLIICLAEGVN